eukprot:CAMPEP_0172303992 /NCGR_PEP_ID=MMETSP1058-20130122/5459_1 /TAXON_ID=83371 /ORGANISM="Detonula confervacea, Strain CCMP 353" /LENGTH=191 /DNA_ID=CAMNT_0013015037 /DNA_START=46 /DNA_END=618 /DNA_ORIENTATION=-
MPPHATPMPVDPHRCKHPTPYLILTNISKRQNIKKLLQLAAAYGCPTIFVVGQKKFEFDPDAEGTEIPATIQNGLRNGKMKIVHFDKLHACVEHIKSISCCVEKVDANNIQAEKTTIPIIGVEIDNSSLNLEGEPFTSSVAFMMGNEGSGMTDKQMSVCDGFIRISQYGGGTASLNVSVAAGLVLHRFFHW